ncbi:MAG: damage-inducible protein DinB [Treponema sp.]|jgi:uncharacterized damage-inducible protein DinB|nr:damage-inducible protein DinB [Treponema sp.]
MKETYIMLAQYNQEGNKTVFSILDTLSHEEREQDRGSYYGSLSSVFRHVLGGTIYFQSIFKSALGPGSSAVKALSYPAISLPEGNLTEAQWKSLGPCFETADAAQIEFISALTLEDYQKLVKVEWYKGDPATVPLYFLLQQLMVHGIHHRGQISQILDSLKIDNNYSGINVQFLST